MIMKTIRDWYTMSEAAKELGVSRQRMHQIVEESKIQTMQIHKRLTVVSADQVAKLKKKRQTN